MLALEQLVEQVEEQNRLLRQRSLQPPQPPAPIGPALVELLRDYLAQRVR